MDKIETVPVRSYHKATLIALYNNEGEVKWNYDKLSRRINSNEVLLSDLQNVGYDKDQKDFTASQVQILFSHISHPILNEENRSLLKINSTKNKLLNLIEKIMDNKTSNFKTISEIDDKMLESLGLKHVDNPDFNNHYIFENDNDYYFIKNKDSIDVHVKSSLMVINTIKSTKILIQKLLKLKNTGRI